MHVRWKERVLTVMAGLVLGGSLNAAEMPYDKYITKSEIEKLDEHQLKGLDIAIQQDIMDQGWKDSQADMFMILRNGNGTEKRRSLSIKSLEVKDDGDKSLTVFEMPKDVKGTAFLTYSHTKEPDEQWLYLPALKRVKRISSHNKSGPFMGSEFAFEDLVSFEVEKYFYNYLRDEDIEGFNCYVVERFPKDENSGYKRIVWWVDKESKRVIKSDFYDRKDVLLKTLQRKDYKLYDGKYWRAHTLLMNNHQTGKSTLLGAESMKLNAGLSENDFSKNSLQRAK